jgi:hypothetical protein
MLFGWFWRVRCGCWYNITTPLQQPLMNPHATSMHPPLSSRCCAAAPYLSYVIAAPLSLLQSRVVYTSISVSASPSDLRSSPFRLSAVTDGLLQAASSVMTPTPLMLFYLVLLSIMSGPPSTRWCGVQVLHRRPSPAHGLHSFFPVDSRVPQLMRVDHVRPTCRRRRRNYIGSRQTLDVF